MKSIVCICILFTLLSCGRNDNEKRNSHCGGNLQLLIAKKDISLYTPSLLDETDKQIANQVHLGLFRFNPQNLTLETAICKSWDIDNTGRVYVFYLDSTACFHNDPCFAGGKGRNVTAYDFEYTFYLLATQDEDNKNFTTTVSRILGAKEYYQNTAKTNAKIPGIQVVSDYVLKITLETPSALFMYNLAHPAASVIAKEAFKEYGKNLKVGAGAFSFSNQTDSSIVVLERNKNFFMFDENNMRLPYLDTIQFLYISNYNDAIQSFLHHDLDAMLFVENNQVPTIVEKLSEKIPYRLVKSLSSSDVNNLYYNVIHEDVQNLYTNNSRILDVTRVFFNKNYK